MKRPTAQPILWIAALLAIAPTASEAQLASYLNRCSTGSLGACFSVTIATTVIGTSTRVVLNVTNLEGAPGFSVPQAIALETINIWRLPVNSSGNELSGISSSAGSTATPSTAAVTPWSWTWPFFGENLRLGGALVGCTVPGSLPGFGPDYWQTCGTTQSLVIDFTVQGLVWDVPDNVGVTLSFRGEGGTPGRCILGLGEPDGGRGGRTETECAEVATSTIPEPATLFLFATGLAALMGVRLSRRRQLAD